MEDGYASARLTALAIIASLQRTVGDLDGLTWLRSTVYVNAAPDLQGPALTRVADGFSDVVNEVFADRGITPGPPSGSARSPSVCRRSSRPWSACEGVSPGTAVGVRDRMAQ